MEDPSRNLAQHSELKRGRRPRTAPSRWTILVIGDLGKIVSLRVTKPVLVAGLACLAAGLAFFVYSLVSYNATRLENRALRNDLNILSANLKNAEKAREEALVHLMLMEDTTKKDAMEGPTNALQESKDVAFKVPEKVSGDQDSVKVHASETPKPLVSTKLDAQTQDDGPVPPVAPARVSIEDLEIWPEPEASALRFQFVVKNIDRESGKVAGYTFIVLESKEGSGEASRVFPSTPLENGLPSNFKDGHYFSIARYTSIQGTLREVASVGRFETATVYAYSDTGNLLVEKVFEVRNTLRS